MPKRLHALCYAAMTLLLWGCATAPMMVDRITAMIQSGMAAYDSEPDLELLREALPAHIKLVEIIQRNDPAHPGANLLLAQLYGTYALAVLEARLAARAFDPSVGSQPRAALRRRMDAFYQRGAAHALLCLEVRHKSFGARMERIDTRDEALGSLDRADVPALFWYAFNLGSHVNLNRTDLRILARGHLAESAMRRVTALVPDFAHGAAHIFLMAYYAAQPTALGRPSDLVEAHHRAVQDLADGAHLAAAVVYAREVLVRRSDRDGFIQALDRVLASGDTAARCLLDRLALEQAALLRAGAERLLAERKIP